MKLKENKSVVLTTLIFIAAFIFFCSCQNGIPGSNNIEVFYEEIPGSTYHSPNGTWWGHNQSKIVRYQTTTFMYIVENQNIENGDPNIENPSAMVIYKKEGDDPWQKGASFNCSRPGNIVIGSDGTLHAIVFEPTSSADNGSIGKLVHYSFPNASSGDITDYQEEIIIDNDGTNETVNIRVGASINSDDTIAVAFGLYNESHTEQLYYKKNSDTGWTNLVAGENLGHDFYYPYVIANESGYILLPVQDDYVQTGGNLYQIIPSFIYNGTSWEFDIVKDLTGHELASERLSLLEQSDVYLDTTGTIHAYFKEFLDPAVSYNTSAIKHVTRSGNTWVENSMDNIDSSINWVRAIEYNDSLYYLCVSWDKMYLKKGDNGGLVKIDGPEDVTGIYPYLSAPRGGTNANEDYIDVLLLNGDSNAYPNAKNYYLRIAKKELQKLE